LSENGGINWDTIIPFTANDGSQEWSVVANPTAQAKIKISNFEKPEAYDISDANFNIVFPSITVTSPNSGEDWLIGSEKAIKWKSSVNGGYVVIDLSRDGGKTWETFVPLTNNDGNQSCTIPGPSTTQARIRVSYYVDSYISDTSDYNFTISPPPLSLTVTAPNGGEKWQAGANGVIKWKSNFKGGYVKIELSTDGGTTWKSIIPYTVNDGNQSWPVFLNYTAKARIRVSSLENPEVFDISDSSFSITKSPLTPPFTTAPPPTTTAVPTTTPTPTTSPPATTAAPTTYPPATTPAPTTYPPATTTAPTTTPTITTPAIPVTTSPPG
jgi:hypothetical protein